MECKHIVPAVVIFLCVCSSVRTVIRRYYIAADDVEWDYAPTGRDLIFSHQSEADLRIKRTQDRIGSVYTKCIYKQYTDSHFLHEIPKPAWQGYVGPIIRAEVGDTIVVHFKNRCSLSQNISIHPHGIFYTKFHEGALYLDGERGMAKLDDGIPSGHSFTYLWNITDTFAPAKDDDRCVPWAYHSHVDSMSDIEVGLVGLIVICIPDTLRSDGLRRDVRREYALYTDITDEGASHFIHHNLEKCLNPAKCRQLYNKNDAAFKESNKMYHINGYVYGNMPDLDNVCEGEEIIIYVFALANGIHDMQIYGQTFIFKNHRMDTIGIYPATFVALKMKPVNPGTWLLICRNNEHLHDGMTAFFNVTSCSSSMPLYQTPPGRTKRYYIAAEEITWNYMTEGKDLFSASNMEIDHGFSSNAHHHMHHGGSHDSLGNTYKKVVYVEYEDESFTHMKPRPPEEEHLHLLGPPIKLEVGDIAEVYFKNKASRPYSIFPHGVAMEKHMEGSVYYLRNSGVPFGRITKAGDTTLYNFTVPWQAAPTLEDPNCLTYTYHSAVDVRKDTNSGLIGPLLVCKPEALDDNSKQVHVNREFFILFSIFDENLSWYIDESIKEFAPHKARINKKDEAFKHGNLIHGINGRIFGTLAGLEMCLGDRVSWHFFALGSSTDLHTVALEGNALSVNGKYTDTQVITPGLGFTGYMHPDDVGKWALYCHVHHHLMAGMAATYSVNVCPGPQSLPIRSMTPSGFIRRYYIAAVEIEWDYAPSGIDKILGEKLGEKKDSHSYLFTRTDGGFLGTVYKKVVYREFTDGTFNHEKKRGYREIHLGMMGPFIRANVGDVIEVVFMNKASRPYSIKPHGVFYNKSNDGMKYNDGSVFIGDNEVQPGKQYTYHWTVPNRAGPGPNEPNCIGWVYHSGSNMVRDTPSGLFGPLVICKPGILDVRNKRTDHHTREFAVTWYIINENRSWYIRENMKRIPQGITAPHVEFEKSNLMNSINGYIYGNTPGMVMEEREHVTWYLIGLGSEDDYHTVHFHGLTYLNRKAQTFRGDTAEVFPGTFETVEMYTDNPGTWLLHCHVMQHLVDGMEGKYAVLHKGALKPLEDAEAKNQQRVVAFKLPVRIDSSPPRAQTVQLPQAQSPQTFVHTRTGVLPPSLIHDLPQTHVDGRPMVPSTLSGAVTRMANAARSGALGPAPAHPHEQTERLLAQNPDIRELYSTGILPGSWQIQNGATSVSETHAAG